MRDLFQRALRGRKTDALHAPFRDRFQPFQREGQVRPALGGHDCVDLVDDDGVDPAQAGGGIGGQQQVQGFRRGDEDLCRVPAEEAAFFLRCVASTDTDRRLVKGHASLPRHVGDAGERRTQVAFHIHGECFERA